jgi:hypothetical protein
MYYIYIYIYIFVFYDKVQPVQSEPTTVGLLGELDLRIEIVPAVKSLENKQTTNNELTIQLEMSPKHK